MVMSRLAFESRVQFQTFLCLSAAIAVAIISGCGRAEPSRAAVSGSVKFQGKSVEFGDVIFQPVEGEWRRFYAQAPIRGGTYRLESPGAIIGTNRVEIHGYRQTGRQVLDVAGKRPDEAVELTPDMVPFIPPEFNAGSTRTVEIKPGANENMNFEL
jgi:hypothetical protein